MKKIVLAVIGLVFFISSNVLADVTGKVLMTTSDYISGNTASYDLAKSSFSDNILSHYQDATVRAYGRYAYILEGGDNSNIIKLDMDDLTTPVYQFSVGAGSNPHDMVFLYDAPITKGYVFRYNSQSIWVVNLSAQNESDFKITEIDISQWADSDGSPDAHMGFIYEGYIYAVLQRYDMNAQAAGVSVIIKIDPETNTVVDMKPETPEIDGIDLIIKNPQKGSLVGNVLYFGGTTYMGVDGGVMSIDLSDPAYNQTMIFDETTVGGFVQGVNVFSGNFGIVYYYDNTWSTVIRSFDPESASLGEILPIPDARGGALLIDSLLYIGSGSYSGPGMYIYNPFVDSQNAIVAFYPTSLPPYSIAYLDGNEPRVSVEETVPPIFDIAQPYPNPFNPSTTIEFSIDKAAGISVDVYNISGQKVSTIVNEHLAPGKYSYIWNAEKMSSGIYFIRISDSINKKSVRATLVK